MTFSEFVAKYNGGLWDFDGYYGAQCADLINFYVRDVFGNPQFKGASAKDFYGERPDLYDWIKNTPTNFPNAGDIVVWDGTLGNGDGHIDIVMTANVNTFIGLDQNWGPRVTHFVAHNYQHVIGWGRPKGKRIMPEGWTAESLGGKWRQGEGPNGILFDPTNGSYNLFGIGEDGALWHFKYTPPVKV